MFTSEIKTVRGICLEREEIDESMVRGKVEQAYAGITRKFKRKVRMAVSISDED